MMEVKLGARKNKSEDEKMALSVMYFSVVVEEINEFSVWMRLHKKEIMKKLGQQKTKKAFRKC
jgi:hypothetical protein